MTGEVQITDEVVAIIAGLAATEIKGVRSLNGNITYEMVSRMGMKSLSRGVRVKVDGHQVLVHLAINLEYGFSIPKTSKVVQEKVKTTLENMTGLEVKEVNVRIAGVNIENQK